LWRGRECECVIVFPPLKRQLSFRFSIRRCDRLFDGSWSWRRKRQREYYLANVSMIDEEVGEILKALEAKGLQDNRVVVVFTSDDGDTLRDHGQSRKWTMYEQVLRVPLIVWSPRAATKSLAVPALAQHMDIGATTSISPASKPNWRDLRLRSRRAMREGNYLRWPRRCRVIGGTGMIELVGLIPLHASPHTIYDHMDKKLHARTAKDQGPASRDADRGCPQYAARAEAPAKGHERSRLGGLTHI
jgi:Sulfatase